MQNLVSTYSKLDIKSDDLSEDYSDKFDSGWIPINFNSIVISFKYTCKSGNCRFKKNRNFI